MDKCQQFTFARKIICCFKGDVSKYLVCGKTLELSDRVSNIIFDTDACVEFVFTIPRTLIVDAIAAPPHKLMISQSPDVITASISIPAIPLEEDHTIKSGEVKDLMISEKVHLEQAGKSDKTVVIRATGTMTVLGLDNHWGGGDCFLALPTSQLGMEYYVLTLEQSLVGYPSFFTVSALCQTTSVNFTTKAGVSKEIVLNAYESYRYNGAWQEDMTGTNIKADHLISVNAGVFTWGSGSTYYCCDDAVLESIPPVNNWGYEFVLAPWSGIDCGYVFRLISHEDTTLSISNLPGKVNCDTIRTIRKENGRRCNDRVTHRVTIVHKTLER